MPPTETASKAAPKLKKTATVQLRPDLVFWANRLAEMEDLSVSDIIDPLIREVLRQRLAKDHDTDPDIEWQKKLRAMARRAQD